MDERDRQLLEEIDRETERQSQNVGCGNTVFLSGCFTLAVMAVHFAFAVNDSLTKNNNPWFLYLGAIYPLAIVVLVLLKKPWHALGIALCLATIFVAALTCSVR